MASFNNTGFLELYVLSFGSTSIFTAIYDIWKCFACLRGSSSNSGVWFKQEQYSEAKMAEEPRSSIMKTSKRRKM
jgi:hypothetical protein